jgi:methylenetetrahydrofolate--tRNA-(uracil-5-)-methyltransferase
MTEEEYDRFVEALNHAEKASLHSFERRYLFEGCLPIEEMAERGRQTLAYGPLKPVGLVDPRTGRQPFAVVQLRQDDRFERLYNLVGFQTRLKYDEQRRVFQMVPGLERAEFVRLGSIHRNTFIDAPRLLGESLHWRNRPQLFFAGQITGVEGYMESAAMGLLAGINAYRRGTGKERWSSFGCDGALINISSILKPSHFSHERNFGLFPPWGKAGLARLLLAQRALRIWNRRWRQRWNDEGSMRNTKAELKNNSQERDGKR